MNIKKIKWKQFKIMAQKMVDMNSWEHWPTKIEKVNSQSICHNCGLEYIEHPIVDENYSVLCSGEIVETIK